MSLVADADPVAGAIATQRVTPERVADAEHAGAPNRAAPRTQTRAAAADDDDDDDPVDARARGVAHGQSDDALEKKSHDRGRRIRDDDDDDALVVYDERTTKLTSPPSPSTRAQQQQQQQPPPRRESLARSSMESLSFGYAQHLLPLSLSRGAVRDGRDGYDDDDDDGYGDEDDEDDVVEPLWQNPDDERAAAAGAAAAAEGGLAGLRSASSRRRGARRSSPAPRFARGARADARRTGLVAGVALTVGVQIGSGIFSSPGVVTLNVGSVGASLVVWVVSGVLAWTGASSFAELGAAIPVNGGAQAYLHYSYGPLMSYLYAWTAIVALKPVSAAIIAIIFGEYLARVLFHTVSRTAGHPHEQGLDGIPEWSIKAIACLVVVAVTALNALSSRLGTRTQVMTTVVKLAALLAVPVLAAVQAGRGRTPDVSRAAFSSLGGLFAGSSRSAGSYVLALYSGLWAYDGWDQSSFIAGELKNANRDLPRIIHSSLAIVMVIFVTTVVSYFVVLPTKLVAQTNTVGLDFGSAIFGAPGGILFALLVAFSCFGALNGSIYTSSRLVYAAGREGYLPSSFGALHPRTRTPLWALSLQCALILLFATFGSGFASLVNFYAVCSWSFYFATVAGLLVLRVKEPNLERSYKAWLPTPIIFTAVAAFLLIMPIFSAPLEALAAFAFVAAGAPVYLATQPRGRESLRSALPAGVGTALAAASARLRGGGTRAGSASGGMAGGGGGGGAGAEMFGRRTVRRKPRKPGRGVAAGLGGLGGGGTAAGMGVALGLAATARGGEEEEEEEEEGVEEEAVEMLPRGPGSDEDEEEDEEDEGKGATERRTGGTAAGRGHSGATRPPGARGDA